MNLSDIAAMGAKPRFALISLLLPPMLDVAVLDSIYAGLREETAQFGVALVGGNIARNAERLIIDITLLGIGTRNRLRRRDSAKSGDVVMVTGNLGSAAAGLLVLEDEQLAAKVPPESLVEVLASVKLLSAQSARGQLSAFASRKSRLHYGLPGGIISDEVLHNQKACTHGWSVHRDVRSEV